jgi:hypothetical protein
VGREVAFIVKLVSHESLAHAHSPFYKMCPDISPQTEVSDGFGHASGALYYDLDLAPRAAQAIYLAIPFGAREATSGEWPGSLPKGVSGVEQFEQAVRAWEAKL